MLSQRPPHLSIQSTDTVQEVQELTARHKAQLREIRLQHAQERAVLEKRLPREWVIDIDVRACIPDYASLLTRVLHADRVWRSGVAETGVPRAGDERPR